MESFPLVFRRALAAAALLVLFSLVVIPFTSVSAGTFNPGCNVTNLVNNIATAGSNGQDDTINLASGCTYTLSSTLTVNGDSGYLLTINGNNAILDGNDVAGVLLNSSINVLINNVTIRDGSRTKGGGIYNTGGTVTLTNVTISGGTATDSGGGIYNAGGTMTLTNSTVSDSSADQSGGGIYNSGAITLNSSTVSGNSAGSSGGGMHNDGTMTLNSSTVNGSNNATDGGGINNSGTLTLNSSTVSGNWATYGGGIYNGSTVTLTNSTIGANLASHGGGIYNSGGTVNLNNSTLNLNHAATLGGNIYNSGGPATLNNSLVANSTSGGDCADVVGYFVHAYYSLMEDASCTIINGISGNRTGDPNLGALTGSPGYYPLLNGSNAINAGSNALVPGGVTTDQAGNTRIRGGIVDMGSYETNITPTVTPTAPAPDVNLISNGTFSAGLTNWAFSGTTQQVSNGALQIAPASPGGSFFQFVNFNSAGEIFEVNFRAGNSSATAKTLNLMVRDSDWSPLYNCVFGIPAFAPFQNYRMRFDTSAGFIPMVLQGALSGDNSLGVLIDDITMVRKTAISVLSTECTVSPPPNVDLVYDGAFNQGTANWAAFNAAMQVVNIGGANGNVMEIARWQGTPNGGFYQFNPYSAPANGVLQFTFQIGNQSNQARVINMLVRSPDWTDMHSCFITVPANTPLTSQTILLKTGSAAWTNIVIQGWIQVGNYNGTPPLPFRFDNLNVQYLPSSSFSGSTQCPGPIPMPQHPTGTLTPSPSPINMGEGSATPSMTATTSPTATASETPTLLPSATATASETPTDVPTAEPTATLEPPTDVPTIEPPTDIPTDVPTEVPTTEPPTAEPPTVTAEPPTPLPQGEGSPTAEVTEGA